MRPSVRWAGRRAGWLTAVAVATASLWGGAQQAAADGTPPKIGAIHAQFVQSAFATFYTIKAEAPAGTRVRYDWKLSPPAVDPGCKLFVAHVDLNPASAIWHHGDQDGCDHTKQGPQGHLGTVTVVVTATPWVCTATYFGTETGDGKPAACDDQRPPKTVTSKVSPPAAVRHVVNPVEDPTILYKRVMGELSKENLQIAKDGGLFSFIPYFKDVIKGTAGLKEKDTFVEVILGKIGLTKVGLGTAAFKKGFAVISIVGDVSAITFNLGALYQGWQAADPPRSDYEVVAAAAPVTVALPSTLTADAPQPVVAAANALLTNALRLRNVSAALLTTFERVQGAYRASDGTAEAKQAAAGARFADRAAGLVAAQPRLAAALVAATRAIGGPFTMPAPAVAAASRGRRALAPELTALFQQLRLTPDEIAPLQAQLLQPSSGAIVFPDFIASPELAAADRKAAESLHGFATFLRSIAKRTAR